MTDLETLLKKLQQEEEDLQFTHFTNEMAWQIGSRFVEIAQEENLSITVDITRNGQQLFHVAMPGTAVDNDHWVRRKNNVVNHFGSSSFLVRMKNKKEGTTIESAWFLDPKVYSAFGGAFPIIIQNVGPVGTITVSGLTQSEDHNLVVRVIREFI